MEDLSNLENLSSLSISDTAVKEIPGLGRLENLRDLELRRLQQVRILPDLRNLNKLSRLQVDGCPELVEIQGELPRLLNELSIKSCNSLGKLPDLSSLMGQPKGLIRRPNVVIEDCRELNEEAILGFARQTRGLLYLKDFEQLKILRDLSNSNGLIQLYVQNCGNLDEIQGELPQSLEVLEICSCGSLQKLPDLSNLKKLRSVTIKGCKKLNVEEIRGFAPHNPGDLTLEGFEQLRILRDLSNSNELRCLHVQNCGNLVEIQGELPQSLQELEICSCGSLEKLPDLTNLKKLRSVTIKGCMKLNVEEIRGFAPHNLGDLTLEGFEQPRILLDLRNSNQLRCLYVENCGNLDEIQGELPQSLEVLEICSCGSLQKLPDLSNLKKLQRVKIKGRTTMDVEAISSLCSEMSVEFV